MGAVDGPARRTIDADGALVTPGFVDIHTHFDGQVCWDKQVTPSCWHGVTTVVMGNCGVGFAPVRPGTEDELVELMEAVEDIPGTALHEGIPWGWETFGQYLDAIDTPYSHRRRRAAARTSRCAHYVMGERCYDDATADDMARMAGHRPPGARRRRPRLLHLALLRPPRQGRQRSSPAPTPSPTRWWPSPRRFVGFGHGTMEIISDHLDEPEELRWIEHIARIIGPADHAARRPGTSTAASGSSPTG